RAREGTIVLPGINAASNVYSLDIVGYVSVTNAAGSQTHSTPLYRIDGQSGSQTDRLGRDIAALGDEARTKGLPVDSEGKPEQKIPAREVVRTLKEEPPVIAGAPIVAAKP